MDLRSYQLKGMFFGIIFLVAGAVSSYAQQTGPGAPLTQPNAGQSQTKAPLAVPQVNPVVHRLTGLKILNLLRRNGIKVAPLNDEMLMADAVQTSITAGLSLGDGTIVARLPRAELEMSVTSQNVPFGPVAASNTAQTPASLFVIERDGGELSLKFIGLDGGTGLSLLSADSSRLAIAARDVKEETLMLGQHVRVISPVSSPHAEGINSNDVFVKIDVLDGHLKEISRGSNGKVNRLTITAPKLSNASLGGVAVNDSGETIGLVEAYSGNEAQVIPIAGVRRAVERILLGLKSKPRPWLGVRGASVSAVSPEELEFIGWNRARASKLIAGQIGVVFTSVPPQTPAWHAKLRVGDVVTRVNGGEVRNAEDFSSLLTYASAKAPVRFTVVRPDRKSPQIVSVKLDASLDPVLEMEAAEQRARRLTSSDPLVALGIDTLPVTADLAARLNAKSGLFVVFVHSRSAAAIAGMLAGDVIESVNKELVTDSNLLVSLPDRIMLDVVRNGQKLAIEIKTPTSSQPGFRR